MRKFVRKTEAGKFSREEFEHCYIWHTPYLCIDATFLPLDTKRRSSARWNLKTFVYKLFALNENATSEDVFNEVMSIVRQKISEDSRSHLLEADIINIIQEVENNPMPSNIRDIIYSTKKVEWKPSIKEILVITEEDKKKLVGLSGYELIKEERKILTCKKQSYYLSCSGKLKSMNRVSHLLDGLDAIMDNPTDEPYTLTDLARLLDVDIRTIKAYRDELSHKLRELDEKFGLYDDKRIRIKERVESILAESCLTINQRNEVITKLGLHKESGISRTTIYNKMQDREDPFALSDLINNLNDGLYEPKKKYRNK